MSRFGELQGESFRANELRGFVLLLSSFLRGGGGGKGVELSRGLFRANELSRRFLLFSCNLRFLRGGVGISRGLFRANELRGVV